MEQILDGVLLLNSPRLSPVGFPLDASVDHEYVIEDVDCVIRSAHFPTLKQIQIERNRDIP